MNLRKYKHTAVKGIFSLLFVMLLATGQAQQSQTVYHTPSGTRYHTAKCHMVDNTSNGITRDEAIKRGMKPCTFCKPDEKKSASQATSTIGPVAKPGQKEVASQCLGKTQAGVRCKRTTRNANGYCFQHLPSTRT